MPHQRRTSILLVAPGRDPVGAGRELEHVAEGFRAAGWEVHLAVTTTGGAVADRLRTTGVVVHRVGTRPVLDPGAVARLVAVARRVEPGIVFAAGRSQVVAAAALKLTRRSTRILARIATRPGRRVPGWALASVDRVLATSPAVAAACRAAPTDVVLPGLTPAPGSGLSREDVATRLGLHPAKVWTLCVAPLVAESRLERLVWAIDQLGVVRRDLEHVLVGRGPLLRRVLRRARLQELAERLVVVPHGEWLPDLLAHTALVWQSGDVAFGGALLDGMGLGLPAVAVESDAASQLIVDGETGRVVPAVPESEFPRRAFGLLEDPAVAASCGAAGRQRAETAFPVARLVAAHLAAAEATIG